MAGPGRPRVNLSSLDDEGSPVKKKKLEGRQPNNASKLQLHDVYCQQYSLTSRHFCNNCGRDITKSDIQNESDGMEDLYCIEELLWQFSLENEFEFVVSCPNCERLECHRLVLQRLNQKNTQVLEPPNPGGTQYTQVAHRNNLRTSPISLCIIAKTWMNNGHCYIGYSKEHGRLFRPIYRTREGACFWNKSANFKVGNWYGFKALEGQELPDGRTPLPHNNDDLRVLNITRAGQPFEDLFNEIKPLCKQNICDIFPNIKENKYVLEGTNTPSVGLLLAKRNQLLFYNNPEKRRINIVHTDIHGTGTYDMCYTASVSIDNVLENCRSERDIIAVVGLGRPFDGKGTPKRCYILCLGLIPDNSPALTSSTTPKTQSQTFEQQFFEKYKQQFLDLHTGLQNQEKQVVKESKTFQRLAQLLSDFGYHVDMAN